MSATAGFAPWRIGQLPGRLRFLLLMLLYAALVDVPGQPVVGG